MVSDKKLLLMGSSAFKADELPSVVRKKIDDALLKGMTIIVGEAHGACRRYQDYLKSKNYRKVTVGHARSIRYNVGDWNTVKYGDDLKEREKRMIEDCDSAIILWVDRSSVIAANLERLRKLGKPTFVYEYSTKDNEERYGPLEPSRNYSYQRRIQSRSKADLKELNKLIEAFLASGRNE